jgi:hypothetical protein
MSFPLSPDAEEQIKSTSACFHFIPSKTHHEQIQSHSNPQSSFYRIKNPQQSPFPTSTTTSISRTGYTHAFFTVIPPMTSDMIQNVNVRNQLAFFF